VSKAKARARVQKWRDTHKSNVTERHVTLHDVTKRLTGEGAHVDDKTLTSEIEPQKEEQKETREVALDSFEAFWSEYPNKVGKPKARAAFPTALRRAKGANAIMAGLHRYIASKPTDRPWLNPATFLNQERWDDQPAGVVVPMARAGPARQSRPSPMDHFTNYASEINGKAGNSGSLSGDRDDAPSVPVRTIEHHH
jgi:hypothetical protein